MKPFLAITMGDPGGIGPEVIAKSLRGFKISKGFFYLLIGAAEVFEFAADRLGFSLPLHPIPTLEPSLMRDDSINFLDIAEEAKWLLKKNGPQNLIRDDSPEQSKGKESQQASDLLRQLRHAPDLPDEEKSVFDIGKISLINASMAFAALKVAAYQATTGLVAGIITAPVNKTAIRLIAPKFQGHTEYLAKVARTKSFAMMFVGERLKVTLVTIHVPIKKVSRLITEEAVLEKIRLTHEFLKTYLKIPRPRLAVCALNPNGRETGEEDEIAIAPAVRKAREEKIEAVGPLSADQLFHDAYEGRFDAVVSMYHDQGIAPFKMISFRDGVNVTLGLPFIRTSPDHGTAFDIAYQNKADERSMKAALELTERLVKK